MAQCQQCGRNAIVAIGPNNDIPVCVDCWAKISAIQDRQLENLERALNHTTSEMESIAGLPGVLPKFPPRRRPTIISGDITLNHIRVSNSNIGVLNTGSIGTIDSAVGLMRNAGTDSVAAAFKSLTEALIDERSIDDSTKKNSVEILSVLATEAASPKDQRRLAVVRSLIAELSVFMAGAAATTQLWTQFAPIIKAHFGL